MSQNGGRVSRTIQTMFAAVRYMSAPASRIRCRIVFRALIIPEEDLRISIRSRQDFYGPGVPARPGQHYRALVRFARRYAGETVLDLGCGYGAYGQELAGQGLRTFGCDINQDYLREAVRHGFPVAAVDSVLPFADRSVDTVMMLEVIEQDRKSTRLNSSHLGISYAVFCTRPPTPLLLPSTTLFRSGLRLRSLWPGARRARITNLRLRHQSGLSP